MSLGEVFQRTRQQRRLSQRQLAERAGFSSSFVTRLERDLTNPTWRAIEKLAAVLGSTARLSLVPDQAAVEAAADLASRAKPIDRLRQQPINVLGALSWLDECDVPFVVTGAVAALLQGFPTPARSLRILVHDSDAGLLALQRLLLGLQLLFDELEPDELRPLVERSWPVDDCEVEVTLVADLPRSVPIELLSDLVIRALPPDGLLVDEEVAATLRIATMPSSEP